MKIKKRNMFIIVALFVLAMGLTSSTTSVSASNTSPVVYGNITDAFYANLNNQSYYDIQYNMSFNITNFSTYNSANGYYYTLIVGLTYPDGSTYWYQFNLVTYQQSFNLKVIFYDSVTQSGWYTAQSYTYSTYGHDSAYYSCLTFDPPTGVTGGSPS